MRSKFVLLALSFAVAFIAAEFFYRVYEYRTRGVPLALSPTFFYDKELGWEGVEFLGDKATNKRKILVIGDSFTHGVEVAPSDMYYQTVGRKLDSEVFAYGGGGYGTLQEYLALKKRLGEVKPDLILLQVCSNDFINNSLDLESRSYFNNNLMVRPYWVDGKAVYRFPRFLGHLRFWLGGSRLFYQLFVQIDRAQAALAKKGILRSVETDIAQDNGEFAAFRESLAVTSRLLGMIKAEVGGVPVVGFMADDAQPYWDRWKDVFKEQDLELINSVPTAIKAAEAGGASLRLKDGAHWNEDGQRLCGEVLAKELLRKS